jgi:cytochrome b561
MIRMPARALADDSGYGTVTKTLHWVTVTALAAQFAVGYLLAGGDDGGGHGRGRGHGSGHGRGHGRGHGGGGDDLDDRLLLAHVALGLTILLLAVLRLTWRRATPLPPWADGLSAAERRLAGWTERVLYLLLLLIPLSGLALLLGSGEDWHLAGTELASPVEVADDDLLLGVHIVTHVAFFVALAVHLALVLKHQLLDRDRLLQRML